MNFDMNHAPGAGLVAQPEYESQVQISHYQDLCVIIETGIVFSYLLFEEELFVTEMAAILLNGLMRLVMCQ